MSEPFFDGWSVASFFTEFFERYIALLNGKSISTERLAASYRDFVSLEREALQSEQCRNYWTMTLAGAKASRLARRPVTQSDANAREVMRVEVQVPAEVSDGLKRLAQSLEVPLKSVLLASHMKVLSLLTGQSGVLTGLLINGRPEQADGEQILGAFLNTVPLRMELRSALTQPKTNYCHSGDTRFKNCKESTARSSYSTQSSTTHTFMLPIACAELTAWKSSTLTARSRPTTR
jgi:hypothetical protein